MKATILTCATICLLSLVATSAREPPKTQPTIDVLFSPHGGCTARIVEELGKAKRTIRVQAYSFTSAPIAKAVVDAKRRGVDCEVVLDKSQAKQTYSEVDFFHNQGVPTFIDERHAIAHNKIILIDESTVITGSFNFTKAAEESNAENLLVIKGDAELAAKYAKNYAEHQAHSRKYEGRQASGGEPRAPPATTQPARPGDEADPIVYVTQGGSKYHRGDCNYVKKSAIPIRLSEAKRRHTPCSRCNPPTGQKDGRVPSNRLLTIRCYDLLADPARTYHQIVGLTGNSGCAMMPWVFFGDSCYGTTSILQLPL